MSDNDTIIIDTATRIFRDLGEPQSINLADDETWRDELWTALQESGLSLTWVPDELGGAGAGVTDGFDVLRVAGSFAVAVPLAETLLAGWLLSRGGIVAPQGPMTIAPARTQDAIQLAADGTLSGTARRIPFARDADAIAVLAERNGHSIIALVDREACVVAPNASIADDACDDVTFDGASPRSTAAAPDGIDRQALLLMGAAARASQMGGALQAILEISAQYAQDRVAFGRPISKFQAVQHNLAQLAGETAAAVAAAGSAADAIEQSDGFDAHVFLEIAAAKIRVGEAAGDGAAIAHQVHGAIGFTQEHMLHRFTRRLWSWRDDFGGESYWAVELGKRIAAGGADALWPTIAAR